MILLILCTLLTTGCIFAQEPPKVAADYQQLIRTASGRNVSLTCPVASAASSLLVTWYKDDDLIVAEHWMRFRTTGGGLTLRISAAEASDSGRYLCRAVNGFGTVDVVIRLLVGSDGRLDDEEPIEEEVGRMAWTDETLHQPRRVDVSAKSRLTIDCGLIGHPRADVVWLKDGVQYTGRASQQDERKVSRYPLSFDRIAPSDGGVYTCLARHLRQQLDISFHIRVIPGKLLRNFAYVVPANTSEAVGNPTALSCWVPSSIWPNVRWLQLTAVDHHRLHPNTTVKLGNRQFQEVASDETQRKEDGTFLRKMIIDPVAEQHAGTYFCLAENPSGYALATAQLIVLDGLGRWDAKSVPIPVIVVLPSLILVALAVGFVVWLKSRDVASSSTLDTSVASTPVCPAAMQPRGSFQAVQSASPSLSNRKFAHQQLFSMDDVLRPDLHRIAQMSPV